LLYNPQKNVAKLSNAKIRWTRNRITSSNKFGSKEPRPLLNFLQPRRCGPAGRKKASKRGQNSISFIWWRVAIDDN
jgi:hypothetical protein